MRNLGFPKNKQTHRKLEVYLPYSAQNGLETVSKAVLAAVWA
jgi:hypothetical protein